MCNTNDSTTAFIEKNTKKEHREYKELYFKFLHNNIRKIRNKHQKLINHAIYSILLYTCICFTIWVSRIYVKNSCDNSLFSLFIGLQMNPRCMIGHNVYIWAFKYYFTLWSNINRFIMSLIGLHFWLFPFFRLSSDYFTVSSDYFTVSSDYFTHFHTVSNKDSIEYQKLSVV